jgi:glycosyltransferase involved in cell wall biosynthesis
MKVVSPMPRGNGAHIVHSLLAQKIPGYTLQSYNPYWTIFPPALPFLFREKSVPDIIHTTPDHAIFFKNNKPLVISFQNFVLDSFMKDYSSFAQQIHYKTDLRYFTKKAVENASAVTCVSNFTADLVRKYLGCSSKIRIIYNGVDTDIFCPSETRKHKNVKVLFSGNLTKRKGADLLPLIADKLDDGIEILYTSGLRIKNNLPWRKNLTNIGQIPISKMPEIYRGVDIFLFPTAREGFSLAAIEAASSSLPIVATNCSSLPELVTDGSGGYLCELGNTTEFASKVNLLAQSPAKRREMGDFNRARAEEKFTLVQMVKGYINLFQEILDS